MRRLQRTVDSLEKELADVNLAPQSKDGQPNTLAHELHRHQLESTRLCKQLAEEKEKTAALLSRPDRQRAGCVERAVQGERRKVRKLTALLGCREEKCAS